jgi:hypothetical protein
MLDKIQCKIIFPNKCIDLVCNTLERGNFFSASMFVSEVSCSRSDHVCAV